MELVRYRDEETSALYQDGKLLDVGDHYIIDEKISQLLGVTDIHSDAFFRGGNDYDNVAKTLKEIAIYEEKAEETEAAAEAAELERQARELEQKAAELRLRVKKQVIN
jgi:hypothetical protein